MLFSLISLINQVSRGAKYSKMAEASTLELPVKASRVSIKKTQF